MPFASRRKPTHQSTKRRLLLVNNICKKNERIKKKKNTICYYYYYYRSQARMPKLNIPQDKVPIKKPNTLKVIKQRPLTKQSFQVWNLNLSTMQLTSIHQSIKPVYPNSACFAPPDYLREMRWVGSGLSNNHLVALVDGIAPPISFII